jgi:beta-lactamase regulating signal transducer with metallopeptidase domain
MLLYVSVSKTIFKNASPLAKRNLLYILLLGQVMLCVFTCCLYYADITSVTSSFVMQAFLLPNDLSQQITPWIFSAWSAVVMYKLIKVVFNWFHFKKNIYSSLQKPTIDIRLFTEYNAALFGIKRKVNIWASEEITTPLTFGFIKPVILLPVALINKITIQQAETLILHELAHIRCNDYLLNWFLLLSETVFFFNPFILLLGKKLRMEREKACDLTVIHFKYPAALYAETLLLAERFKQNIPVVQLSAVNKKEELLKRIHFFANEKKINAVKRKSNSFIALALLPVIFLCFTMLSFFTAKKGTTAIQSDMIGAVNSNEIPYGFINTSFNEKEINTVINKATATIEKTLPALRKKLNKLKPAVEKLKIKTEELAEAIVENYAMPASVEENDATKQVIIKEEVSGSKNTQVKVYTVKFENGQWVIQPEWRLTAKEIIPDSLKKLHDSTVNYLLLNQQ